MAFKEYGDVYMLMKLFINDKIVLNKRLTKRIKEQLHEYHIWTDENYKFINIQKCTFDYHSMIEIIDIIKYVAKLPIDITWEAGSLHYNEAYN